MNWHPYAPISTIIWGECHKCPPPKDPYDTIMANIKKRDKKIAKLTAEVNKELK